LYYPLVETIVLGNSTPRQSTWLRCLKNLKKTTFWIHTIKPTLCQIYNHKLRFWFRDHDFRRISLAYIASRSLILWIELELYFNVVIFSQSDGSSNSNPNSHVLKNFFYLKRKVPYLRVDMLKCILNNHMICYSTITASIFNYFKISGQIQQ